MLDPVLRRAFEEGRREYGAIPLPFDTFGDRVLDLALRRLRSAGGAEGPDEVRGYVANAAGADLFLAIACDEGSEGAWEVFTARFVPRLFGLAMRSRASRSEAEEVARAIPGDLVARPGRARTRFGTYDGCGSLLSWLSVQVARRLADRAAARRTASIERGGDGSEMARRPDLTMAGSDPSEIVLGNETVAFLEEGLRAAWRDLNGRERDALLWRFRDGLPLQQISMHLGVSVSQASRIVSAGVETVRATVLAKFRASDPARFRDGERLWGMLRDVVARHLQNPASLPDSHPCEPAPGEHAPAV